MEKRNLSKKINPRRKKSAARNERNDRKKRTGKTLNHRDQQATRRHQDQQATGRHQGQQAGIEASTGQHRGQQAGIEANRPAGYRDALDKKRKQQETKKVGPRPNTASAAKLADPSPKFLGTRKKESKRETLPARWREV
ncbi:hypothetical protein [Thiolapillus sp.]|uniref:hypothetical protein n=1 Tax=Thiolapillus sp. TaxID=2017437 RepID=UPI003AF7DDAC